MQRGVNIFLISLLISAIRIVVLYPQDKPCFMGSAYVLWGTLIAGITLFFLIVRCANFDLRNSKDFLVALISSILVGFVAVGLRYLYRQIKLDQETNVSSLESYHPLHCLSFFMGTTVILYLLDTNQKVACSVLG